MIVDNPYSYIHGKSLVMVSHTCNIWSDCDLYLTDMIIKYSIVLPSPSSGQILKSVGAVNSIAWKSVEMWHVGKNTFYLWPELLWDSIAVTGLHETHDQCVTPLLRAIARVMRSCRFSIENGLYPICRSEPPWMTRAMSVGEKFFDRELPSLGIVPGTVEIFLRYCRWSRST